MAQRRNQSFLENWPRKGKTVYIEKSSSPAAPPVSFALPFLGFGIGSLIYAFGMLLNPAFADKVFGFLFLLLVSVAFTSVGVWVFYLRLDIPRTLSIEDLAQRLGVSEDTLKQAVAKQGIVPRYSIKGRDLYRLADFNAPSLLRASSAPVQTDELLRAGGNAQTLPDLLVRGSSAPPSSLATAEQGIRVVSPTDGSENVANSGLRGN